MPLDVVWDGTWSDAKALILQSIATVWSRCNPWQTSSESTLPKGVSGRDLLGLKLSCLISALLFESDWIFAYLDGESSRAYEDDIWVRVKLDLQLQSEGLADLQTIHWGHRQSPRIVIWGELTL